MGKFIKGISKDFIKNLDNYMDICYYDIKDTYALIIKNNKLWRELL